MCRCRAGATSDAKMEQDNQKLFSLYSAVNNLAYLAKMAQGATETPGQLAGLNARFQTGLAQVQQYLDIDQLQQFHLAGGNAGRHDKLDRDHRRSAASPTARASWSPTPISTIRCRAFRHPAASPSR